MLRHWGFAVFLLTVPLPVHPRPTNSLSHRQRRSVGHAQMMHDRGRSLHDRKRRTFIQDLLEQVHTAQVWDPPGQSEASVRTPLWAKPAGGAKNFLLSFQLDSIGTRDDLPQETSKTLGYQERAAKAVSKRKRKMSSGRWRDPDRRRDRGAWLPYAD
ncbi:parathyroid hormone-like hormone b [Puntigrus tetrazona]|uniref:parathyroid hormone-like hormone b n=1 Tax=Puntigrus tetrazona TaxID=1606681 RepID=UPI001C893962|nr:parathyroid hormone-like hormone b [Puntigrus tetrazona]